MPETAKQLGTFQDPFDFNVKTELPKEYSDIDSIWGKLGSSLGLVDRAGYEQWQKNQDRQYERAAINSARAFEEYMDSTKYQRAVKDLEKAGLNPWLAIQSGVSGSAAGTSTATGGSSAKATTKKDDFSGLAGLLVAIAKMLS